MSKIQSVPRYPLSHILLASLGFKQVITVPHQMRRPA
jgi:hypothetical protein